MILGVYKNGNYLVTMFSDGTKIRQTKDNEFIPSFPECCDVKITDKCDGGCPFCYENCTVNGKHGKLMDGDKPAYKFLETLHPYTELALNGNDLTHPELEAFLKYLKNKKVIANLTVNQKHFMKNIGLLREWTDTGLIKGLGISLTDASEYSFIDNVKCFDNAVIHTIAGILTQSDIEILKNNDLKLLILGYKHIGRGTRYYSDYSESIDNNINQLKDNLVNFKDWFKVFSFDNLALKQLDVKNILFANKQDEWDEFYMGDDGQYTFYIDMVEGKYFPNSLSSKLLRFEVGDKSIDDMFNHIREPLLISSAIFNK